LLRQTDASSTQSPGYDFHHQPLPTCPHERAAEELGRRDLLCGLVAVAVDEAHKRTFWAWQLKEELRDILAAPGNCLREPVESDSMSKSGNRSKRPLTAFATAGRGLNR
jgi:hypothetical protein